MRVLVAGLGSMGKRRIRLLKKLMDTVIIDGADPSEERRAQSADDCTFTFPDITTALNSASYDCAFICSPPLLHREHILICLRSGLNTFTELNLNPGGYDKIMQEARKGNKTVFLSSTLLYRKDIEWLTERIVNNTPVQYMYHTGQYLADWHPWENYEDFFVADKQTNGCREIFAIELPWLIRAFGDIKSYEVRKNKLSGLSINYPDSYSVLLEHSSGNIGTLNVDVVSPVPSRRLSVIGDHLQLLWEGHPDKLFDYDIGQKQYNAIITYNEIDKLSVAAFSIIENAYMDEIIHFFDIMSGESILKYTFEDDLSVLKLIDAFEGV